MADAGTVPSSIEHDHADIFNDVSRSAVINTLSHADRFPLLTLYNEQMMPRSINDQLCVELADSFLCPWFKGYLFYRPYSFAIRFKVNILIDRYIYSNN